jgi:hypothetical protein
LPVALVHTRFHDGLGVEPATEQCGITSTSRFTPMTQCALILLGRPRYAVSGW